MELEVIFTKLKSHQRAVMGIKDSSKYAVMLPLVQKENEIHVLFEVRSLTLRRQPGEICFPGGRIDPGDVDEKAAAIRETTEELGIKKEQIAGIFPLDYMLNPFGMAVFPYAGFVTGSEKININPSEVGEIFTVPLQYFLTTEPEIHHVHFKVEPDEDFPYHLIPGGEKYNWRARTLDEYFYLYEDRVIWGMTAKILSHFIEILR